MATAKKRTIADIDKDIVSLEKSINESKLKISGLIGERFKLLSEAKEIPLHQLNLMSQLGRDKAKKLLGDKWV